MLTFYDVALSPFAQKVKIALLEKAIPFRTLVPDLGEIGGDLAELNPRREVPALVDGDLAVFDSSIMLDYLEDKWPEPALRAATPGGRARDRMIEELCDSQFEAIVWGLTEVIAFNRADGALKQQIIARAGHEIAGIRGWLERQLGAADWFGGERLGLADIAVFPYLATAGLYRFGPLDGSPLALWLQRMKARDSVQRTLVEAKAGLADFQAMGERIMRGERPRQYRDHRLEFLVRAGGLEIVQQGLAKGTIRFSATPT